MVQQISLFSEISESQNRVLQLTLETLTGMRSQTLSQHTAILKPKFPFNPEQRAGKINQIESYRVRMTSVWDNDTTIQAKSFLHSLRDPTWNESIWTLQLSDIPAAGKRTISIQNVYETTVWQTDDILGYIDELGYLPETEYWSKGFRFYYNDVIIEIFRLYVLEKEEPIKVEEDIEKQDGIKGLKLLDVSGKYQIKCYVNVTKLNDLDNIARGVKQLENLKSELSGLIELEMHDRINMDSRINSRIVSSNQRR